MEGGEVGVNVRMKDYWENRYTHKQVSQLSFRWDRGIFGVCLPIISFQNLKNITFEYLCSCSQLLTPTPTLHLTPKQVF